MTRYRALVELHAAAQRHEIDLFRPSSADAVMALREAESLLDLGASAIMTSLRAIDVAVTQRPIAAIQLVASVPEKIRLDAQVPMTEETLAHMVAGAQRDLLVFAFELKSKSFREKLRSFLRVEGRRVRIVLDHRVASDEVKAEVINWSDESALEIWQYVKRQDLGTIDNSIAGIMHAKVVVADRLDCLIGSANFTDSALNNRNFELGVRFSSSAIAETLWRSTDYLTSQLFRRVC